MLLAEPPTNWTMCQRVPSRHSLNSDRLPMEAVVSFNSHQFSSEEPLQERPVLLFWLQRYWVKMTKPLNICLHTGSEPNYLPLLLLTHFGEILNSFEFSGKTVIHIRDVGWAEGAAVLCWIWFCLSITNSCLQLPCTGQTEWLRLCKAAPLPAHPYWQV